MSEKTIQALLTPLGFTEKEVTVYLAIQKQGKVIPADLAELTGINRTTVYSVAKELVKKGMIIEDLGSAKRELIAQPPEDLHKIIERERKALDDKQKTIDEAIVQIKAVAGEAAYPVPKIQFVKEDKIEKFLYDRTPIWNESILKTDNSYLGFQEEAFTDRFVDWIDWYWKNADPRIHLQLLSNDSTAEKEATALDHKQREIIFWKEDVKFSTTTWVMGDYVVMLVLSSSPNYLVEIHDARFAENERILYKAIIKDIKSK